MAAYSKFYFRPQKGELITTDVRLGLDGVSAISGRVSDVDGKPIENAMVLLSKARGDETEPPEASFVTDSDGQFFFGPLQSDTLYIIKIFKNQVKLRELEIVAD